METQQFFIALSNLSDKANKFGRYWFGDSWTVTAISTAISTGFSFAYKPESEPLDLVFFIRLDDNRVPILELPAVSINVPAGGMKDPYHFVSAAFCLVQDADCRRGILSLFGELCDLIDDCSRDA